MTKVSGLLIGVVSFLALSYAPTTFADGRLTVYCSASNEMCEQEVKTFAKAYHVDAKFVRTSSGSTLAKLLAEKGNPQADVWYGGTFDTHLQAAEMDLLKPYHSPVLAELRPEFQQIIAKNGDKSSVILMGVLGIGVNTARLKQLGLPMPKCWKDLIRPEFKQEIITSDPRSSGTAYTAMATFVQLWGEKNAFDYMKALDKNILHYSKSGVAPGRKVAAGEVAVGIGFLQNYTTEQEKGAPVEIITPCEGTGYSLFGLALVNHARNEKNAKLFIDWALSKEAQELSWRKGKSHHILTNQNAQSSPYAVNPNHVKLIDYDFHTYGDKAKRNALIEQWRTEVKGQ